MGKHTGAMKTPTLCGEGGSSPWVQGLRGGDVTDLMEAFSEGADEHVTWGHPCPTPGPRVPVCTRRSDSGVWDPLTSPPICSQGEVPPPPGLQAGAGPWKDKSSAKTQTCLPGGGRAHGGQLDNSLLGEHDSLVLDLAVQGQDVIVDERALQGEETKDAGPAPQPTVGSSGLLMRWGWGGPHQRLAHRRCPTNVD